MKVGRRPRRLVILGLLLVSLFLLSPTVGLGVSLALAIVAAVTHSFRSRRQLSPPSGQR